MKTVHTKANMDQALAILRDASGPLLSREVGAKFPRQLAYPTCGHHDCTEPRHQQERFYVGITSDEARLLLKALEKKGLVRRFQPTKKDRILWMYVPEADQQEITALEEAFRL